MKFEPFDFERQFAPALLGGRAGVCKLWLLKKSPLNLFQTLVCKKNNTIA
jgi:hypothetical protein